ncbi:MAG TPA: alpha/beta fold hydrolase [Dongiaceae bacterium]|nr:alpha/beta fold hydrolase [Dongiaceae bacterium]
MSWHYVEKGQGRPLVLLHGIGMNSEAWGPVFDRLAVQRRVIALDIPGFGKTPGFPDTVEPGPAAMVDSLGQALKALGIHEPVDLVGNSLGGRIALEAAARGLARTVVGISPAGLWKNQGPHHLEPLFGAMRRAYQLMPGISETLLGTAVGRTLIMAGAVSARGWKMPVEDAVRSARLFAQSHHFEAIFDAFRPAFSLGHQVKVPCTIAFGDFDFVFPLGTRDRSRAPAHTRWARLPACGHVPMWDDPDRVSHLILSATH